MEKHAHHNLWLLDNGEIESFTGGVAKERTTIHEWPLSSVQRLQLEDGRNLIY